MRKTFTIIIFVSMLLLIGTLVILSIGDPPLLLILYGKPIMALIAICWILLVLINLGGSKQKSGQ